MSNCFKNILLIDDDEDDIHLFTAALEIAAPDTVLKVATSCPAAMKQFNDNSCAVPEGIFLDLVMNVMSGVDCITLIKNNPLLKDIPIVVLSSSSFNTSAYLDKLFDLGASYFITKPPSFQKLTEIIGRMVNTPAMYPLSSRENFYVNEPDKP